MNFESDPGAPETLSEESADWFFRLKENPDDRELADRFQAWLESDPAHQTAWKRTCRAWCGLDALPPGQREAYSAGSGMDETSISSSGVSSTLPVRRPHITTRRIAGFTTLALAACVMLLIAPILLIRFQADHYTDGGKIKTVQLSDGSLVTLAGASAITTDIGKNLRSVTLLSGEAFFDVTHDPDRPFVVSASDLKVRVLGTRFNVRQGTRTTGVALLQGSVRANSASDPQRTVQLHPGQLLELSEEYSPAHIRDIALEDIASWRNKRLVIVDQTVASVAEQIGRYQSGWISIPDRGLASKRVTGVYDLSDPEQALNTLIAPFNGQAININGYFTFLTRL